VVDFLFEQIDEFEFNFEKAKIWLDESISKENQICGDICFVFCSDAYLLKINQQYLNHDYFTDVITFDYSENDIIAGDIFISIDRITDNAKQFGVSFDYELLRIVIHGVLHLLGYNDKQNQDKILMTSKEDEYLNRYYNVEGI